VQGLRRVLQHLWVVVAAVSVLFPLPKLMARFIPLASWGDGGLIYLSPALVTGLATRACLFVVPWMFGRRGELRTRRERGPERARTWLVPGTLP
jgi:hypothetical protein